MNETTGGNAQGGKPDVADAAGAGASGSASNRELDDRVSTDQGRVLDVMHGRGTVDAGRTRLRGIGADNSARGVWRSRAGRRIGSAEEVRELAPASGGSTAACTAREEPDTTDDSAEEESWRGPAGILREMKPDAFERLCQRLLREHGFTRVEVSDGGIDE